jgi:hypothetical protein
MDNGDQRTIGERFADTKLITEALGRAVGKALLRHKKLGNPICTWRDGKVVWIPPEQIPVDELGNFTNQDS